MQSEKDKMLAGQPYVATDAELVAARMRAKSLCHRFNIADPTDLPARMAPLRDLLELAGEAHIEPNFFCDYGFNICIGESFYANHNLTILDVCRVEIGANVLFGPGVMLSAATHPLDPVERLTTESGAPIRIGDSVWLGGNVAVLPGVTIGDNCVIGAGSVVNRDIPSNTLAVGNPCRVVREL
ncbi:sugar O-acetyltransferase [Microbulbifer halophilus]|uniref:Acetyltransferase n=1 Tax=Microbulbifer halophilus TaxID=453963 RepID=A0ABW5EDS3_9GAMM|nr:sugar O-acetyltransferase [Microbulbifer halophilus]MCW8126430.1 sugar O-acetyltransferase [Microbulbifer halophilus]